MKRLIEGRRVMAVTYVPRHRGLQELRNRRLSIMTLVAALTALYLVPVHADAPGGCDFDPVNTKPPFSPSCQGPLPGSTFEGGDGNLLVNTPGNTDWANVGGLNTGIDLPSGSGDNAFGQGTKEDDVTPTVVTGSIPPNKSDLTRFYEASELANGSNFLYLAWERANVLGTANIDFEVNQFATPGFTSATVGQVNLVRTPGDLLINFDFTNGGGAPVLGIKKWITSGSCFSNSAKLPCWGSGVTLTSSDSEAAVNNVDAVTDPIAGTTLPALTFGETAINLTTAGVFPAGSCTGFGSAFVKSRSSTSFSSEVKDFIAPIPVNINNCGTIRIHKVTENGNGTFGYTTSGGLNPSTFSLMGGQGVTYTSVVAGSYAVTETTLPSTAWVLKSLTCSATGTGTSVVTSSATASITMAGGGVVDCTYTNHINLSPTVTTTLSATTANIGAFVHDSATLNGATANAGGSVTYTVYTNNLCTQGAQSAGVKTVTNGIVPDSNAIQFNSAGTFFWQAVYSGDANNNPATSACTSEQLVVAPNSPTITTTLSETTANIGDFVHDSATLNGATANAGGSVTYTVYTNNQCSQGAQSAGVKTVTNGIVPDSNAIQFNSAGTFFWQAVYSGDANNNPATSACTSEQLVVQKASPTASTTQTVLPNDSFKLTGATIGASGTVTFKLFSPADATCSGTPAFTQTVNVNGSGIYATSNTNIFATTNGEWRWMSTYSGDANNNPATSACGVENFTIVNGP